MLLVKGGEELGAAGLPEVKLRNLYTVADFSRVRRVPLENPINTLYEIVPQKDAAIWNAGESHVDGF